MVGALVEHLGEPAVGAPPGPYGRAFPTPEAMAAADEDFYRDVVRAGYRGAYLRSLGRRRSGTLDLEALARASREELSDDDVATLLLALPGVGPYAAAHIMMLLGRYSRLVLDSWTRPKYAALNGGKPVKDATIERRFRRYGPYAGLAFWLVLTRTGFPSSDARALPRRSEKDRSDRRRGVRIRALVRRAARASGIGSVEAIVMSATTFAGSAQFAAASILGAAGGVASAIVAATLLNARYARSASRWRRCSSAAGSAGSSSRS